jgi:SAM-dependent methyltransferase
MLLCARKDALLADSYDEVRYPSLPRSQSHPAYVAALATIAGFQPPPMEHWRVLEIGCGDGANILPLAFDYPEGQFIGVDRAHVPIDAGRTLAGSLGLANIELHALDVLDWDSGGEFDYIIAHGVYSWVPSQVREKILRICSATLKRQGLAYISYNALPGSHFRRYAWDFLRFHGRRQADPAARMERARELARLMVETEVTEPLGIAVRKEMENVLERDPAAVYHDDLGNPNDPFYLLEFVAQATAHGLQYLGDAEPQRDAVRGLPFDVEDWLEARQYGDFLARRRFRETLLCRQEISPDRKLSFDRFQNLFASSRARPCEPQEDGQQKFELPKEGSLTTNHPLAKDLLCRLASLWPDSIRVSELPLANFPPDAAADLLMRLLEGGAIELRVSPPKIAKAVSARPAVSALARMQVAAGCRMVTNQRHQNIEFEDDKGRTLVSLLDGSRDRVALAHALAAAGIGEGEIESSLERSLGGLHRLCLLTE